MGYLMTVKELIEELKNYDPNLEVITLTEPMEDHVSEIDKVEEVHTIQTIHRFIVSGSYPKATKALILWS
jgi:hypothetical protein